MKQRLFIFVGLLLIALAISGSLFVHAAWLSVPEAGEPVSISIPIGTSFRGVRDLLASQGLVSSVGYDVYALIDGAAKRPQAGDYAFRRGTSYARLARTISMGPERDEVSIRLIEGKTIEQYAEVLKTFEIMPEELYVLTGMSQDEAPFDRDLAATFPFLWDIPKQASLEGYLFPDTYRVWRDALPDALVYKQLTEFQENVFEPFGEQQRASNMTWHQIVTLASIVEAEVRTDEDRKIVAGIFLNRLNNGMRIQSDATLNYVIGEGRARATNEDLKLASPYNSYTHDGLPPGPIGNPSLSSLRAVLEPTKTDYYFFLTDLQGKVLYAKTYEQHLRNKLNAFGN